MPLPETTMSAQQSFWNISAQMPRILGLPPDVVVVMVVVILF